MKLLTMLGDARRLVARDGGADIVGGCGSTEKMGPKVSLPENFE